MFSLSRIYGSVITQTEFAGGEIFGRSMYLLRSKRLALCFSAALSFSDIRTQIWISKVCGQCFRSLKSVYFGD